MKLVLIRHGESEWNLENRFTGWKDVDLSPKGIEEAKSAGKILKEMNLVFDVAYTSYLKRAIKTLNIVLEEMDELYIPVYKSWRLNERHYGALQGLNKAETAKKYGDQCVVLSVDVKRVDGKFKVFAKGGRENTGIDAIEWFVQGQENGAGEVVVNSIDTDGVKTGFDLELLSILAEKLSIPIIASGGAGNMEHFKELFKIPGIDAGLAASIFHFKEVEIMELKKYLKSNGVEMRI